MIDWTLIDTVFLDMDGTLLDLQFDNHFWKEYVPQRFADKHDLSITDARQQLEPRFAAAEGSLDWYCLDFWTQQLGLDIQALKREISHRISVLPDTPDFLEAMLQLNKRCVLVTNAHIDSLNLKMEQTGLDRYFDAIVCSHDLNRPKEDPRFWQDLQQHQPYEVTTTLLVDDSLNVLQSARDYGFQHLVAISQPDSSLPERSILDFVAATSLRSITPLAPGDKPG